MNEIDELLKILRLRMDGFDDFSKIQMDATLKVRDDLQFLKSHIEKQAAETEAMKKDIALIKESLSSGSRH
jgi:cell division protein FtsL